MKTKIKEIDSLIREPFLHIAGRCYTKHSSPKSGLISCLTSSEAEEILSYMDKDVTFDFTKRGSSFMESAQEKYREKVSSFTSKLKDYSFRVLDSPYFDGEYCFKFEVEDSSDFYQKDFLERKHGFIDSELAFEKRYSTVEGWEKLFMEISGEDKILFTKIDLFGPKDLEGLSSEFYVSLYSHKKEGSEYKKL